MTLIEVIQDIYEGLGEPSDLQYTDRTDPSVLIGAPTPKQSRAWTRLVGVVNRAQLEISSWKFPDGRQLRFREVPRQTIFKTQVASETISCTAGAFSLTGTIAGTYSIDNSWLVDVAGEIIPVMSSDGGAIYLARAVETVQTNLVVTLSRKRYNWVAEALGTGIEIPYGVAGPIPLSVHSINDMSGSPIELLSEFPKSVDLSAPSSAFCTRSYIEFAQAPDAVYSYLVTYSAGPAGFSSVYGHADMDAEIKLPPQYHTAVVLWGLWWGYRRAQENSSAYSTKRDLDDFLRRTRSEADFNDDFRTVQMSYTMEG